MQTPGSSFLHERNPSLHTSLEVEAVIGYLRSGGESIPDEPADKISAYLGFLANEEYVNDGILTGDQDSIDRQIEAHVIKPEDVPEGYFELQRRIARERGHGDDPITPYMRHEAQRIISADQRHSIKSWAEYLFGTDAGYPDWFKLYAFEGVLKIGKFNKQKEEFQKRSNLTTVPFPELNRGALSQVYSWLKMTKIDNADVSSVFGESKTETAFQQALRSGNFASLYALAIRKTREGMITDEQKQEVIGSWKKYAQGSDPRRLHDDLQGFGLGWCTATGYETAVTHLKGGDFFVYYTRDEDGKDIVPRVAIRMGQGEVAEVRGIYAAQELEPVIADITAEQLQGLPGGEGYIRKAEDMKRLTTIEKKIIANPDAELSSEELRFLYELDHEIKGFGYDDDPRISEIRTLRGDRDKSELVRIFPEIIRGQVQFAYSAYRTVADQLLDTRRALFGRSKCAASWHGFERLFAAKDKMWRANGVYEYLVEKLIADGARFCLVATPSLEADGNKIVAVAEAFGKDQSFKTIVENYTYRSGRYSGHQWSGNSGNEPVRFSLIPSRYDGEISLKSVDEQVRLLRERQTSRPELHIRVPSLLTAVTYWHSLRAQGDKLIDDSTIDRTYIRHFDLPPNVGSWGQEAVPDSYMNFGKLVFSSSRVRVDNYARLELG